jgi:hypothetical protein
MCCRLLFAVQVGEQLAKFYMTVYAQYVDKGDPGLAVTLSMFHNVVKIKPIPKLLIASQLVRHISLHQS